ncbi:uncharacterized protein EV420DRAFT_398780 [Desarmillaria tabescens]|uniref:Uncharacterized protein n=1 Tax=Armillaria tabescens TaxID=1929756 RepID=A0AA39J2Y2_ARMTA|nr:uncharacterized protein EV420DRAFT_398780 [Desarmillaria tabescens]KAK0434520.1 hypothetical protein EV420DRAFT_398780 [Desarmillaria tabescens]
MLRVAISHDEDWMNIMGEYDDNQDVTDNELWCRIRDHPQIQSLLEFRKVFASDDVDGGHHREVEFLSSSLPVERSPSNTPSREHLLQVQARISQDHTSIFVNGISSVFALSHMSPPAAYNSPLPSTSPRAGNSVSPVPSPPPLPYDSPSSQLGKVTYTHREQARFFREAVTIGRSPAGYPFVPQIMYKPHTSSDRHRYVEEVNLDPPIYFWVQDPSECGLALPDALHSRVRRLIDRDEPMFKDRGPSISVRIEWPGYLPWSRQIPARDFRTPPCPITRSKLAKNVAKCVQRFIQERQAVPMEDDSIPDWRVGTQPNTIRVEDLVLVSLHHVSMGSWQPHLRLRRPLLQPQWSI